MPTQRGRGRKKRKSVSRVNATRTRRYYGLSKSLWAFSMCRMVPVYDQSHASLGGRARGDQETAASCLDRVSTGRRRRPKSTSRRLKMSNAEERSCALVLWPGPFRS